MRIFPFAPVGAFQSMNETIVVAKFAAADGFKTKPLVEPVSGRVGVVGIDQDGMDEGISKTDIERALHHLRAIAFVEMA